MPYSYLLFTLHVYVPLNESRILLRMAECEEEAVAYYSEGLSISRWDSVMISCMNMAVGILFTYFNTGTHRSQRTAVCFCVSYQPCFCDGNVISKDGRMCYCVSWNEQCNIRLSPSKKLPTRGIIFTWQRGLTLPWNLRFWRRGMSREGSDHCSTKQCSSLSQRGLWRIQSSCVWHGVVWHG